MLKKDIEYLGPLLHKRLQLDDNKEYLAIIYKSIKKEFISQAETPTMNYETIYRFKGVFQNITNYNRRNLIP